jgi:hypothetical protein
MAKRFRAGGRAVRVLDENLNTLQEGGWMSARDLKFVIIRDLKDGYKWRLRSAGGERREFSASIPGQG